MKLKNMTAVVTGGASGLGEAAARRLIMAGMNVGIFDLNETSGLALASELGDKALFCITDVADENSVKESIAMTTAAFGSVHIAVNCAGIATPAKIIGKNGLFPISIFNRVVAVNLIGSFNVLRFSAEQMAKNDPNEDGERGVIINTASIAAFDGQIGQAAYSASKAGLVGLTLPAARELADYGIRVATIAPGLFYTPLMDGLPEKAKAALEKMPPFPKRLGKPSEFAELVHHIAVNAMINGDVIRLDAALRMPAR